MMKLYVANRAEIASRVIRTAKRLKIPTVVGYCQEDAELPFVREATKSILINVEDSRSAYLDIETVISTAKSVGATHLHPGYGFLSENADFVRQLTEAGIKFVGPADKAIEKLGDKIGSRVFLKKIDVPLLPSYEEEDQTDERLQSEAEKVGYPLLIKPSAGGGGKGMEIVRKKEDFLEALQSSRRVAKSSFGDDRVFLERFIDKARHIEVQILADESTDVRAIGERECSLQRRHQKVVEECPCEFLSSELRERIYSKSIEIASAVGYVSAGTVEWIWDGQDGIYFLEVNTRLQVEHPVTEMVYGIDLVEWQLRIARGEKLTDMPELQPKGHAIEMRICAEDPQNSFFPTGGKIHRLEFPEEARVDFGYKQGNKVGVSFDSMLGKLIVHSENRSTSVQKAIDALENFILIGPLTNRAYLIQVLKDQNVQDGELSTNYLSRFEYSFDVARALKAIKQLQNQGQGRSVLDEDEELDWYSPWGHIQMRSKDSFFEDHDGKRFYFFPFADWSQKKESKSGPQKSKQKKDLDPELRSPMPAKVTEVLVSEGEEVEAGQVLMILEAMKMEHKIRSPFKGSIGKLAAESKEQVDADQLLIVVNKGEETEAKSE